ncbi:Uncharacterised protein [Bacillus tequilensis]|nr:Uncharacterised protein [Bacillus tequilensis]
MIEEPRTMVMHLESTKGDPIIFARKAVAAFSVFKAQLGKFLKKALLEQFFINQLKQPSLKYFCQ